MLAMCAGLYSNHKQIETQSHQIQAILNEMDSRADAISENFEIIMDDLISANNNFTILFEEFDLSVLESVGIITDGIGHGSCFAVGPDIIVTAKHCVIDDMTGEYRNEWIEINDKVYTIVDIYVSDKYDIAILKIDGSVPYLDLGAMPGLLDEVYIVGSPENIYFENNITKGVITNLGVSWNIWTDALVADAVAWWGNSGGPLFNTDGQVIGILVGGPPYADGINLCENVEHLKEVLGEYNATD